MEHQLAEIVDYLRSLLHERPIDAAVVRARDINPGFKPKLSDVLRRGLTDGAIISVVRRKVPVTKYLTGKQIGELCGEQKDVLDTRAAQLFDEVSKQAGSAALAATNLVSI